MPWALSSDFGKEAMAADIKAKSLVGTSNNQHKWEILRT